MQIKFKLDQNNITNDTYFPLHTSSCVYSRLKEQHIYR